ncbi:MAG: type I-E CRISPR-associated protein Cas5/CasD [Mangrovicoccus sp.]
MPDYLVFQLAASLGAMGEFAGHERRGSLSWPGRSALIGLMGAAMGIRRDGDFAPLEALQMAVAVFAPGSVLRDYHTVESVPSAAVKAPQSRPEALRLARAVRKTNTTITLRDYRCDPVFGVAVWAGSPEAVALSDLCATLKQPVFPLYLGRKSCPLAAPLDPAVHQTPDAETALARLRLPWWLPETARVARLLATDALEGAQRRETRHDQAVDRARWHFAAREVAIKPVEICADMAEVRP